MSLIEPGLVLICRHLVRKSSTEEMRVYRYLCGGVSSKPTSGINIGNVSRGTSFRNMTDEFADICSDC